MLQYRFLNNALWSYGLLVTWFLPSNPPLVSLRRFQNQILDLHLRDIRALGVHDACHEGQDDPVHQYHSLHGSTGRCDHVDDPANQGPTRCANIRGAPQRIGDLWREHSRTTREGTFTRWVLLLTPVDFKIPRSFEISSNDSGFSILDHSLNNLRTCQSTIRCLS